ncbi:HlyD family efflux transporter periplasmic adaptor subunit [Mucilaginibacter gossypii]|uniref:efflux RND transporter periplasmic adaptor subunit n=1 Tax=Mucilaginibacter gossypii TaxID=551996 RepID=UPI000DCBD5AF|nr:MULTISPECIES: HlyD family efflux transporter periplasmic adaptor subunit [Mucilaginibacter]QTE37905.1 HlyD family efflux transporter periplasmic adaptor subunit [Mucilaginibacter gossypii]RAV48001.1 efflux transporter periplasmic adaptor subunit [Mucilaginibacter rubeus]
MDKEITLEVTAAKRKKSAVVIIISIAVLVLAVMLLRGYIKSTITRAEITTAKVEIGNIENTINATGEVLPEFEEIITSPINASIKSALMDAGNKVKAGQSILTLDKSATQTDFEKQKFQLETKRTEISKLKLDLNKSFYDIQSNNDIKQLHISNLADAVENAKRLYKAGGGTRENIEQAELNLKVAQLEKKQLENEIKSKQQTMQLEIKEAEIAADIQQNDLKELQRKLDLANVVATRAGVITYVNKNIGANIHEGETLARIADLGSFRIQGSISDNSADQLHSGLPVIVRINDDQLRGHVSNVSPSVQNSIISFDVQLDDRASKLLRPNMKVDVFLVTATHNKIMRVANGPAFKGPSVQDIFVMNNGKAERRTVHIGLTNFDYVEIQSGLKPDDVIITSDMSEYKNSKEVTVKN